ncbi:hypothetical protein Vafri_20978, partial [Volvox africanus]
MAAHCHQDAPMNELVANILGSRCPYNTLGITTEANLAEVKSAYRRLCLLFHPDKSVLPCQLASEIFQVLHKAYDDVVRQQKHVDERPAFEKGDLWCQFYTDPVVSTEARAYAAPASATGGSLRPTQNPRQGGLWGSARCPATSAWSRQNAASAPTAHAEAMAESVDADEAQHEDEPSLEDDPAASAGGKGLVAADATIPVGKRRRRATDNSKQHQPMVASSECGLGGLLQRRDVAVGLGGHFVPRERGLEPASMKSPGLENIGPIFVRKQAAKDARGTRQRTPESSADMMQGPQPGNAWARRPVFSAVVRQALYPSLFAGYQPRNAVAAASMGGDQERLRTFAEHVPVRFCTDGDTPDFTSGQGADDRMTPPSTGIERACSSSDMEENIWGVSQTAARNMAATNTCISGLQPAVRALRNQSPEAQPLASQEKDATMARRKVTSASAEPEPPRLPIRNDADVIGNVGYKRRAAQRLSRRDRELVDGMHTGAPSVLLTTVETAAARQDSLVPAFCAAPVPCAAMVPLSLGLQASACDASKATSPIPSFRFYEPRDQCTVLPPNCSLSKCSLVTDEVTQLLATRSLPSLPLKAVDAACPGDGRESGGVSQQQFECTNYRGSGHGSAVVHDAIGSNNRDEDAPECDVPPWEFKFNENGEDAEPDDAWWHEPIAGGDDGNRLAGIASDRMHRSDGVETGVTNTLDMFLEQVQETGELQAKRVGQARLRNVHRIVMRGRHGKGRRGGARQTIGRRTGGRSVVRGKGAP